MWNSTKPSRLSQSTLPSLNGVTMATIEPENIFLPPPVVTRALARPSTRLCLAQDDPELVPKGRPRNEHGLNLHCPVKHLFRPAGHIDMIILAPFNQQISTPEVNCNLSLRLADQ